MAAPLLQAQIPFVPMILDIPESNTYIKLLQLQPVRPSVFTAQILFAAEPVRSLPINTVAPVELLLRYSDLAGVEQNILLSRVAKLPFEALAMRAKEEGFIATEKSVISLWVRFLNPVPETSKVIHFKAFVGAYIRQTAI